MLHIQFEWLVYVQHEFRVKLPHLLLKRPHEPLRKREGTGANPGKKPLWTKAPPDNPLIYASIRTTYCVKMLNPLG